MCILSMVSPTICILYFLHYHLSFLIFELVYSLNITRHAQNGVSIRISTNPILLSYQKNFFLLLSPNQSISLRGIIPITIFSIVSGLARLNKPNYNIVVHVWNNCYFQEYLVKKAEPMSKTYNEIYNIKSRCQ